MPFVERRSTYRALSTPFAVLRTAYHLSVRRTKGSVAVRRASFPALNRFGPTVRSGAQTSVTAVQVPLRAI